VTNHTMLFFGLPLIVIGLGLLWFFLHHGGENLVNKFRPHASLTDPNNWTIGPLMLMEGGEIINPSLNMPLHPAPIAGGLFVIDMPNPTCEPHYVTVDHGPLTGATRITLKGRIEGGPFFAKDGVSQASLCLYFQRQFDDWNATVGNDTEALITNTDTQYYRWFATSNAMLPMVAGEFELTAALTDKWTALRAESEDSLNPHEGADRFRKTLPAVGEVGFVLGGGDGWGHGIIATKPSRIIITGFVIA
jgi:hypothetical protein